MAISSMRSEPRSGRVFATIRFGGDLDPATVTTLLGHPPSFGHRRGETFRYGPRSPEQVGKTGVWFLSTAKLVESDDLPAHTDFIVRLIAPTPGPRLTDPRFRAIQGLVESEEISVSASCFWAGRIDEAAPSVPSDFTELISRLHGTVEIAFDHDWVGRIERANVA